MKCVKTRPSLATPSPARSLYFAFYISPFLTALSQFVCVKLKAKYSWEREREEDSSFCSAQLTT